MSRLTHQAMLGSLSELGAIDKIHQAYGVSLSVTAVLNKMQKGKKNAGRPNLIMLYYEFQTMMCPGFWYEPYVKSSHVICSLEIEACVLILF